MSGVPRMIPAGYMAKSVAKLPATINAPGVDDIYAVSGCMSEPFVDYIKYWLHNGYWLLNSRAEISRIGEQAGVDPSSFTCFYYEVFDKQYDEEAGQWSSFSPDPSFPIAVEKPLEATLAGFDVTSFSLQNSPECSPLSCNHLAQTIPVNRHCLFDRFEDAFAALDTGKFSDSEPGPFRIFAVYVVTA